MDPGLFSALSSLLAVARAGSVGAAARLRHRTSSAISQQIRHLESHVGVKLLERAGRGIRLTPAAETALPAVRRLFEEAEVVFGQLAELSGRPLSTLRVAVSDYLGKALLAPVLRELLDARAPFRFEIVTAHSHAGVRLVVRGEVDLAVVTGPEPGRGLEARPLFDQPFAWVGPRRRRVADRSLVERLGREPVLRLGAESQGRRLLDHFLERERIQPVSTIDVPSVSLLLSYVSGGLGVGLVPALALAEVRADRVVVERAEVPALPVALVSRASSRATPALERFASRLAAEGARAGRRLERLRWRRIPRPAGASR